MNSIETIPIAPVDSGQRRLSAWILLAGVLSFAALAAPFFAGRVYVGDDLGEFHLPLRNFYAEQLRRGESFDWMPSLYGGFYVAAEGQLGAYHPLHVLLYRWLPLGAAFDIELLASYPFLFTGMFLFLKRIIRRRDAALFGALAFTFCSFNLLHFVHPNAVAVVAHIPWLLFCIDVTLSTDGKWQRATAEAGIGLLTASQLLLGYPQYVWLSLLLETAYTAWRATRLSSTWKRVAMVLLAKTLGVLAGGVQLLPTFHAIANSVRRQPDAAFAVTGSLHPLNLIQLVAPYLFQTRVVGQNTQELGFYVGTVPCLLCVWLVANRRHWGRYRPLVHASLAVAAVALLLAAGEFGRLYRVQSFIPLVNRFRFPCRTIVLTQFAIASAAAIALGILLERVRQGATGKQVLTKRPLAIAALTSVAFAIVGPLAWPQYVAPPLLVWCGPLLFAIAAALIARAERGSRAALVALVLFTAADLSCYGLSYSVYPHTADLHEFVAKISVPPGHAPLRVTALPDATGLRTGDRMLLAGLARVDGYAGLEPVKRLDYTSFAALQLAGVNWISEPATGEDAIGRRWVAVAPTAPRARLVAETTTSEHSNGLDAASLDPSTVQVIEDKPGRITLDVDAPLGQLLVTTESFDSGWQAAVDGQPRPIARVNGDFLGCAAPAGRHRVRFEFRPPALGVGGLMSVCGLELIMCVFCLRLRGQRGAT